jgi:hypothetical protein
MSAPFSPIQSQTSARSFYFPFNKLSRAFISCIPGRAIPVTEVYKMAAAAQAQTTPTATDPVQRWLANRGTGAPGGEKVSPPAPSLPATYSKTPASDPEAQRARRAPQNSPATGSRRAPFCASSSENGRAAINRANSAHSTGPRTELGKQRSSLNALRHGLTARTAVLPSEDPGTYLRHIRQFLDEYAPATPTETQLVHEIANTAWRLNRIPFLEAELLSRATNPSAGQAGIDFDIVDAHRALATLGLHGSRLSRQFQKAIEQLHDIQDQRRRLERRQLNEAAELFIRQQRKGLPWDPASAFSNEAGFVFSKEQIERHAQYMMRHNPTYYAAHPRFQADPPPARAAF